MKDKKKKVYVGLSGGVDSSVSALLLKEQGYDVTGVFIKTWHPEFLECNWKEEMRDAMRVCAKLEIPFLKLDLEEEYKKEIVEYMIEEYRRGRTPNPDVMCNRYIKFGKFLDWSIRSGASHIATGHYAQVRDGRMFEAIDSKKDQTYFLWTLSKEQLEKTLFPVGHLRKSEVRDIAEENNLVTSEKKDSQGLCFMGHVDMKEFLKRYIDTKKGPVLDNTGEVVGEHDGVILYTIGERHGFRVTKQESDERPHYVISKDLKDNTITISSESPQVTASREYQIESLNIINQEVDISSGLEALTHYNSIRVPVKLKEGKVEFQKNVLAVPGQSVVFYKNSECMGGAIIS